MAVENYGSYAELGPSIAQTPVSTDTFIYFIGTCADGELYKAHLITSMSDYAQKLGGAIGDGHNLTEAAIAAFNVAGLNRVYMIPVSHDPYPDDEEYMGEPELFTGIYALEAQLRDNPTVVNLVCAPSVTSETILSAILGLCKKADGHWDSFMVYDMPFDYETQINARGYAKPAAIVADKKIADEQARAVWGRPVVGGMDISGAAVQACLMAKSDAGYGCPARCGGNLEAPSVQRIFGYNAVEDAQFIAIAREVSFNKPGSGEDPITTKVLGAAQVSATDPSVPLRKAGASYVWQFPTIAPVTGLTVSFEAVESPVGGPLNYNVVITCTDEYVGTDSIETPQFNVFQIGCEQVNVQIPQASGNELSADGVCSWINYSGQICTWGDHTSAFSGGTVADERARFDNSIRMLQMIINRFQLKYRFSIDDPMTLSMRNDVIDEQTTYMYKLVGVGGLIGDPICEFRAEDNSVDQVAQGYFTWKIAATPTIPAKYMKAIVSYSQAGLSVYVAQE